jgi:hypothetical protein
VYLFGSKYNRRQIGPILNADSPPIKFVLTIKTASMSASGFRLIAQLEQGVGAGVGAIVVDELYEHLHLIDSLKR